MTNTTHVNHDETIIRDGLYDRIPMSPPALALISTPAFLRLDRIQQLGFVSRVWPGAKHTRFEHSLGVMHLTRLAVDHLRHLPGGTRFTGADARTIIAAALLHDIGHYPYSHAIEELGPPILSHEEAGRRIIERSDVAGILERDWNVDPARVAGIIHGDDTRLTGGDRILRGLLSGTLDMDKLDYLPRDARACNVPYGGVDTARLISALRILDVPGRGIPGGATAAPRTRARSGGPERTTSSGKRPDDAFNSLSRGQRGILLDEASHDPRDTPRIGITSKGISPLHSLINARQEMFDNVYWHHTNRACMIMLLRALQEALIAGAITAGDLTDHDDASLLAFIRGDDMPPATRRLADALAERRIHKRAIEVSARAESLYDRLGRLWYDRAARREVELRLVAALADRLGEPVADTAILIDIPKPEKWKTDVWVTFRTPPVGMHPLMHWRDVVGLGDDDFKRYEEHRRMIRIVTEERYRDLVTAEWESLLYPALGGAL